MPSSQFIYSFLQMIFCHLKLNSSEIELINAKPTANEMDKKPVAASH